MEAQINYSAVLIAGIAPMIVGFLWYGPLFGKLWMSLIGFSEERLNELKKRGMGRYYGIAFVAALLTAFVLAWLGKIGDANTLLHWFQIAFWVWLGFVVTTMVDSVLWEGKSWKLYLLNISQKFVSIFVMAIIFALWK